MPTVSETAKTAAPRRTRAKTPTATKATPAKVAPAPEAEEVSADGSALEKVGPFELEFERETKSYVVFKLNKDTMGAVGSVYAPLGTQMVKVVFYGTPEG